MPVSRPTAYNTRPLNWFHAVHRRWPPWQRNPLQAPRGGTPPHSRGANFCRFRCAQDRSLGNRPSTSPGGSGAHHKMPGYVLMACPTARTSDESRRRSQCGRCFRLSVSWRYQYLADCPAKLWLNILMMFNLCVLCAAVPKIGRNAGQRAVVGLGTVQEGDKSYLPPHSVACLVQVIWGCGGGLPPDDEVVTRASERKFEIKSPGPTFSRAMARCSSPDIVGHVVGCPSRIARRRMRATDGRNRERRPDLQ
jgi:hypothetical protein